MSALNHMISPNDKPSLCNAAERRETGDLCRVMTRHGEEDDEAQNPLKVEADPETAGSVEREQTERLAEIIADDYN